MTTESKNDNPTLKSLRAIDTISRSVRPTELKVVDEFERAHLVATALTQITRHFTKEVLAMVAALQNTPEGFRTDKPAGYKGNDLIGSVRSALLQGARLTGDEFCILQGRCYLAKAFFRRQVSQFEGVSAVKFRPQKFSRDGETAWVPCVISLRQHGKLREFKYVGDDAIGVRVNSGMTVDALMGKCEKKAFQRCLNELLEDDVYVDDNDDVIEGEIVETLNVPVTFAACDSITECDELKRSIEENTNGLTADQFDSVCFEYDQRVSEIRASRGEASNTEATEV